MINASARGSMCFTCLIFSLSGPCDLLFLLCFYCLLDLRSSKFDVISLHFVCCSVNGPICLVCCVFVNCLVKQFGIYLGVVAMLLLNVMEVLSVGGWNCSYIVYPSKMTGPFMDNCLRYFYL